MKNFLGPVEDGFSMRASGPWAAKKLDYLKRYIEIFEISMRKKWPRRNFVDLFSGPGKCRTDSGTIFLGSPLIALTTTFPFTDYFFADIDSASISALEERCKALPLFDRIRFLAEDSNKAVARVISEIQTLDRLRKSPSLNLAFLDPEGLELEWKTVAALASVQKMDLIIHYPVMGLKRNLANASKEDEHQLDLFFGDKEWRTIYTKAGEVSVVERELLIHYKRKLQMLGYTEVKQDEETENEPAIKNTKGGLLYRLLFASKNPLGDKFWKEVIKRDVHGQRRLF